MNDNPFELKGDKLHVKAADIGQEVKIILVDKRSKKWLQNLIEVALFVFIPLILGFVFDNAPMQWVGFVFSLVYLIIISIGSMIIGKEPKLIDKSMKFTSPKDAIRYLNNEK